jgi:threonine dehydrogenase-like Zn-dependent dehydrogenase
MPEPKAGEVLVKVLGVTTCPHWDMHIMEGVEMIPGRALSYPYTPGEPGHEAVGDVVALGEGVDAFEVDDRVAAWRDPGTRRQGCYAQYVAIDADQLIEVPKSLPLKSIASLELAMCVQGSINQLRRVDAVEGKRICVSGLGPSGIIAVQMARAYDAKEIIAVDPLESRRALGTQAGADVVAAPDDPALPTERFSDNSYDSALDSTGLKVSIEQLMTGTNDVVAIFGVLREDVIFGPGNWWGGFTLMGYGSHERIQAEQSLRLIEKGSLDLSTLVTHEMPLSRYAEGVDLLRRKEALKILFLPWEEE